MSVAPVSAPAEWLSVYSFCKDTGPRVTCQIFVTFACLSTVLIMSDCSDPQFNRDCSFRLKVRCLHCRRTLVHKAEQPHEAKGIWTDLEAVCAPHTARGKRSEGEN